MFRYPVKNEVVTTLKIGEDRYIQTVTTSGDGKTCIVMETCKTRLLVWNLDDKRLEADYRLDQSSS